MTSEEKSKRRTQIQEQAEAKKAAKELTYWLTRERGPDGALNPHVDVWLSQPKLVDNGTRWEAAEGFVDTLTGPCDIHYARWTPDQCLRACRVYPETERECIRVGQ